MGERSQPIRSIPACPPAGRTHLLSCDLTLASGHTTRSARTGLRSYWEFRSTAALPPGGGDAAEVDSPERASVSSGSTWDLETQERTGLATESHSAAGGESQPPAEAGCFSRASVSEQWVHLGSRYTRAHGARDGEPLRRGRGEPLRRRQETRHPPEPQSRRKPCA